MMSMFTRLALSVSFIFIVGTAFAQPDCVNNPTYGDPPPASFFNTGTNGVGGTLPGGSNDLNWQMSTTGINGPYSPAIVMTPVPAAYYTSPWPDCAWIAHNVTGFQNGDLDVYYKFSFNLDCYNACHQSFLTPGVFCLSLDFFADNSVSEIIVNGVTQNIPGIPVADPYNYQGYIQANMVSVSLCNNWQPGNNDLIIHIVSGPPYEGFLAQASVNTPPSISDTVTATICNGDTYVFGPDVLTTAGTYLHTFASQSGCDSLVTLFLTVNPSYNTTTIDTICKGDSVLFAGTYYNATGLYTHTGTTTLGCDSTTHLQLTMITVTSVPLVTNVNCHGDATGSITINANNSPPGYTYSKNAGPYTALNLFTGLAAGTYTIHTKTPFGCIKDDILTVTEPPALIISGFSMAPPLCHGASGSLSITAGGGTPNYTYALDTGPYTINTSYLATAGSHTLHIKDAYGCTKDTTVTMTEPALIGANISITNEPCYGQTQGVINVTGTGGVGPYTYALNAAGYGAGIFSGLAAGTYTIHVKDANNCVLDTLVQVTQPASLGATLTVNYPKCYGDSNGNITVVPNGGTTPFTYAINNGTFTGVNIFTGLHASIDSVHVVDNNGCKIDTVIYLPDPVRLSMDDVLITNVKCAGGKDGTIQVFMTGGKPDYSYALDQMFYGSSNEFEGLLAGQHIIHVKDMNDCTLDGTLDVTEPLPLGFSGIVTTNAVCEGDKNGTVLLEGTGGTPSYSYSADGVSYKNKTLFDGLGSGTYTFYLEDSLGCKADTTVTVAENPHIVIADATVTTATCYGTGDGTITVNASGGTPPLRYQLDGKPAQPTANPLFTGMAAGAHTITVTDSNNCTKAGGMVLLQPAALILKLFDYGNPCYGLDDYGAVYVDVKGGTPPYQYMWNNDPQQTSSRSGLTGLANGKYNVRVTDANDCMAWGETTVQYNNCCTPDVPNAFTPNGDGKNDFFRLVFKGNMFLEKMIVYNRYGKVMFSTSDLNDGWDGTYNGVPQDVGTYFYYIEFHCGDAYIHNQIIKGDVTLIR